MDEPANKSDGESDEEDEDYVPAAADDDDEDGNHIGNEKNMDVTAKKALPYRTQCAVDEAFESLFGTNQLVGTNDDDANEDEDEDEYSSEKSRKRPKEKTYSSLVRKKNRTRKKKEQQQKHILAGIFGKSAAMKIMKQANQKREGKRKSNSSLLLSSSRSLNSDPIVVGKVITTETRTFAGKVVQVKRAVDASTILNTSEDPNSFKTMESSSFSLNVTSRSSADGEHKTPPTTTVAAAPPASSGGLDSVLSMIGKPFKMNTVEKTSADWDLFKDQSGLEHELEERSKSNKAYLVKKDFLNRVDQRRFEHEKVERERKRRAAAAAGSAPKF